jgi:ParB family chromosome partitioning protein
MQSVEISNSQRGIIAEILLSKILKFTVNGKTIDLRLREIDEHSQFELCDSIYRNGLLNPIIVRGVDNEKFEVISGRRRIEAFKRLGLRKIPAHVLDLNDKQAFEISLIENLHSEKISPIEEATAFKLYVNEFGWGGITDLSKKISKSVSYVDRRIKLLELPEDLKKDLIVGKLKPSIADELLSNTNADHISQLSELIRERSPTLREFRLLSREIKEEHTEEFPATTKMVDIDRKSQRSLEQAIIAIKFSMNKIASIANNIEENWLVYETLMQHKRVLHEQIDILYKEKRKLRS